MILRAEDCTRQYAEQVALDGIDFACERGAFVAIYGPSGSGKTTLLNVLGTLDTPDGGTVRFDGVDVGSLSERERDAIRADRIGFVFQSFRLVPYLSAAENVRLALWAAGIDGADDRVGALLLVEPGHQLEDPLAGLDVEVARRLVREHDVRPLD